MLTAQVATLLLSVCSTPDTVLLDFRADYCGPCRQMDPVVAQLKAAGYPVRQVNVESDQSLAAKYHVSSIPCFVLLVNGREVDRSVGATGGSNIAAMFQKAGIQPGGRTADTETLHSKSAPGKTFPGEVSDAPLVASNTSSPTFSAPKGRGFDRTNQPASVAGNGSPESWIAACVRLKVGDPKGNSVGSGTIIDSRQGEALVLTCGHIFRDSDGKGKIFVDSFGPGGQQHIAGRLVSCDLERDVALVGIKTNAPLVVAHVAPPSWSVHKGDRVVGIGCSDGADPTVQESHVNSLDRFRGPPSIQVAGQPVQGRSGGGLFNAEGQVIGVCNAADPTDDEGLFAAQDSIYKELDRAGLTFVYKTSATSPADRASAASPMPGAHREEPGTLASGSADPDLPAMPDKMPSSRPFDKNLAPPSGMKGELTAGETATLAELQGKVRDAEVICIVRPSTPGAKSEIIVLDKASSAFLDRLSGENRNRDQARLTSLDDRQERAPAADSNWQPAPHTLRTGETQWQRADR